MNREDRAAAEQQARTAMAAMVAEQAHVVELKSLVEQEFNRDNDTRAAELMSGQLPAAEQRLQELLAQVEATPYERTLLAEQRTRELEQAREAELAQAAELVRVAQRQAAEALEAEQLGVIRVAMAGIHTERPLIADLQERIAQAEKQDNYSLVAELRYDGRLQAAEQRLQGFQAQVDAIPNGRVLMAELEALQEEEQLAKTQREEQAAPAVQKTAWADQAERQSIEAELARQRANHRKDDLKRHRDAEYWKLQTFGYRIRPDEYLTARVRVSTEAVAGLVQQLGANTATADEKPGPDGLTGINLRYSPKVNGTCASISAFLARVETNGGEVYEFPDAQADRQKGAGPDRSRALGYDLGKSKELGIG